MLGALWIIYLVSSYGREAVALDCSNGCSVNDVDLQCWNKTREYFLQQISDAINNLVGVESMIDKWKHVHEANVDSSPQENSEPEIILFNISHILKQGPLVISDVMLTMELFAHKLVQTAPEEIRKTYAYFCPVPADYMNTLWIYLFVCACIILTLTLVLVTFYVRKMQGEMKRMRIS